MGGEPKRGVRGVRQGVQWGGTEGTGRTRQTAAAGGAEGTGMGGARANPAWGYHPWGGVGCELRSASPKSQDLSDLVELVLLGVVEGSMALLVHGIHVEAMHKQHQRNLRAHTS